MINLTEYHPAPTPTETRRMTDWKRMTNKQLRFAMELLSSHNSPFEIEVANEISRRIVAGKWDNLSPTPIENLPQWLKKWPFRLLWRQRGRGATNETLISS